ncbi:MAG: fatty acid desaturase [Boseongicola sp.]|nr:fatty acid desaturase [Boseongicola sp.]MDD9977060.1 fatty acid desaturase [Boseongicola sp.]
MTQDYSLTGQTTREAEQSGLANPSWYRTDIDPAKIRSLMKKDDRIALRDALLWLGLLLGSATFAVLLWPSWWSLPFWLIYGVLYSSASDARWHECGHRTAFKTPWMNEVIYQIASFCLIRSPIVWRASHVRHHTDTIIVGRDPEIQAMRPPDLLRLCANVFGLIELNVNLRRLILHASGKLHPDEATYVRDQDIPRVVRTARIWTVIFAATIGSAVYFGSWLPILLIGGPRVYGTWHMVMTGVLQHLGMAENVTDHRLNTRTVMMNPISRFIYLNMNYHVEHHMFTMVPYYRLPDLHEQIKHDLPPAYPSLFAAFRELIPVLLKQLRYQDAVILPKLPDSATPYRPEVEKLRPHAV